MAKKKLLNLSNQDFSSCQTFRNHCVQCSCSSWGWIHACFSHLSFVFSNLDVISTPFLSNYHSALLPRCCISDQPAQCGDVTVIPLSAVDRRRSLVNGSRSCHPAADELLGQITSAQRVGIAFLCCPLGVPLSTEHRQRNRGRQILEPEWGVTIYRTIESAAQQSWKKKTDETRLVKWKNVDMCKDHVWRTAHVTKKDTLVLHTLSNGRISRKGKKQKQNDWIPIN